MTEPQASKSDGRKEVNERYKTLQVTDIVLVTTTGNVIEKQFDVGMEEPMDVPVGREEMVAGVDEKEDLSQSVPSSSPAEKIPVKKNDNSNSVQKKAASADRRDENATPVTSKKTKTSSSATSKTSKSATSDKPDKKEKTGATSSSPSASKAKASKSSTTASSKASTGKRQAASPLKKRKIAEIQQEIQESDNRKAKLMRDKARVQKYLEDQARVIKFPIKDELVVSTDVHGNLPTPLPEAPATLALASELAGDAIRVWDFLNTFRKQMSLNAISLNAFVDLLKFTGRASPALAEIYCAPLKLLLGDSALAGKLSAAMPKKLNFAHRAGNTSSLILSLNIILNYSSTHSTLLTRSLIILPPPPPSRNTAANSAMSAMMKGSLSSATTMAGTGDDGNGSSSAMEVEVQFSGEAAGENFPYATATAAVGEFDCQYNGNPPSHISILQSSPFVHVPSHITSNIHS